MVDFLTDFLNIGSPKTNVSYAPVTTTSSQADYSKKYVISTQNTFAPVTTTNTTTTTTNAPQYLYAPVLTYGSPGATSSGASATLAPALNLQTGPYVVPTISPSLQAAQTAPSSQGTTQTPTSSGPATIAGIDFGTLLLIGGGLTVAYLLLKK